MWAEAQACAGSQILPSVVAEKHPWPEHSSCCVRLGCSSQGAWAGHEAPHPLLICSWGVSYATGSIAVLPNLRKVFQFINFSSSQKGFGIYSIPWLSCTAQPYILWKGISFGLHLSLMGFFISFDNLEVLHQKIMSSHSLYSAMLFVTVIGFYHIIFSMLESYSFKVPLCIKAISFP